MDLTNVKFCETCEITISKKRNNHNCEDRIKRVLANKK